MQALGLSSRTLLIATRKVGTIVMLGPVAIGFAILVVFGMKGWGVIGFDFKGTLWEPGRQLLHGHSPYPPPTPAALDTGNPSVYPPLAFLLTSPLSLLPFSVAFGAWVAVLAGGVAATLWFLGVRDWRCYALAFTSCAVVFGIALGNVAVLLAPLAAYVWRERDRPWRSGAALGIAIAVKLVLWPLLIWFVATRRNRAALIAGAVALASTFAAWAAIDFDGLSQYPRLLSVNTDLYGPHSWSLFAGGLGIGLSQGSANAVAYLIGIALLIAVVTVARGNEGDRRAFSLALVATVALVPIVWAASLVVLLVPLALSAPSASKPWYCLSALWLAVFTPRVVNDVGPAPHGVPEQVWRMHHSPPPTGQIGVYLLFTLLMTGAMVWFGRHVRTARTI
jgi:hypothetical protein